MILIRNMANAVLYAWFRTFTYTCIVQYFPANMAYILHTVL